MQGKADIIEPEEACTLPGLFLARVQRSRHMVAYRYYSTIDKRWQDSTWAQMIDLAGRWQTAMRRLRLPPGSRVAVMLRNCREWVVFEQAALALGLVVVPLYVNDRPESVAYILNDADVKLLLIENNAQWQTMRAHCKAREGMYVWSLERVADPAVINMSEIVRAASERFKITVEDPHALATIIYTSGTTGKPKGVMLSHHNILWNAKASLAVVTAFPEDVFLSFLPLSHTFERTIGYYLPMMAGSVVAYARSIPQLAEDLLTIKPTILISVPRIYERSYNRIREQLTSPVKRNLFELAVDTGWKRFCYKQGVGSWNLQLLLWPLLKAIVGRKVMAKLGGHLRVAVCGGAPMPFNVGKTFIGLGLDLLQGYGMTELSPVVAANRVNDNDPVSIGPPLPDVEVKIGADDELLVRSPGVMKGYWNAPEATAEVIEKDGWLHTGDKARIDDRNHIVITGRLKDIIVLANGEKVSPADMEAAVVEDSLFEQVLVLGDDRPYLSALLVLNADEMVRAELSYPLSTADIDAKIMPRIMQRLAAFPGYAQIRRIAVLSEPWTVENELLTPTLKARRSQIIGRYQAEIDKLYEGHR
ncbi:MAG: long-chain fatty acid--CoA ligase [Gammaproteobacteria bacterium]|nr:long-chain fatty acid--CoA ligase [Gammaproteobacteria bacterium]